MPASERVRYWTVYFPGLAFSLIAIALGAVLGGPIAAALVSMVALPSVILSSILTCLVLIKYNPVSLGH